jgi:hypothetical protein
MGASSFFRQRDDAEPCSLAILSASETERALLDFGMGSG